MVTDIEAYTKILVDNRHNYMAKKSSHRGSTVVALASVAALSAAAYLLFGPKGKENRKNIKGWVVTMKGKIIEKMEAAKEVTAPVFEKIVHDVAATYKNAKHIAPAELALAVQNIKKEWHGIAKHAGKKATRSAGNTIKKAAKKTVRAVKKASR